MQDKRQTAFADYRNYIGMDISTLVQLPLFIMEPYTMLQKVAEIMEYSQLLDKAATTADPYERCASLLRAQPSLAATAEPFRLVWPASQTPAPWGASGARSAPAALWCCALSSRQRAAASWAAVRRLAWVAGFCLGPFGGNERTWKPFNPILGETFEVERPNGARFLAEQARAGG